MVGVARKGSGGAASGAWWVAAGVTRGSGGGGYERRPGRTSTGGGARASAWASSGGNREAPASARDVWVVCVWRRESLELPCPRARREAATVVWPRRRGEPRVPPWVAYSLQRSDPDGHGSLAIRRRLHVRKGRNFLARVCACCSISCSLCALLYQSTTTQ